VAVDIGVGVGPVVVMGCGFCGGGGPCGGGGSCGGRSGLGSFLVLGC
jgi:hypothetical protein